MFLSQKNKSLIWLALSGLWLSACDPAEKDKTVLYPIDSLLEQQSGYLSSVHAKLSKQVWLKDKEENSVYVPTDSAAWLHELAVVRELSAINKPVNRDRYQIKDGLSDDGSNLTVRLLEGGEDVPVRYFKVFYQKNPNELRRIEAAYRESSLFVSAEKKITLEFISVYNKIILTSYSIEGGQKMFLGDSVTYVLKGNITLP
jgi:hypothetical protein